MSLAPLILGFAGADPEGGWLLRLLGRFHPMVVHFPIALIFCAAIVDGWRLLRGRTVPGPFVQLFLILGTLGGILSAALGWFNAAFEKPDPDSARVLALHRWLGVSVVLVAVLATLVSFRARHMRSRPAVWLFRSSLWMGVVLVVVASHYGGILVYGEGYVASALPSAEPPAAGNGAAPLSAVDFQRDIEPIFQKHCVKCHGPEKQKGKLRLDTRELAVKGGQSGRVILPSNGKESLLYTLLLDPDPDSRMPTKEKPLPREKIELIRAWIDQGAAWPEPAGKGGAPRAGDR